MNTMATTLTIAVAQIALSVLFVVGYFVVLWALLNGWIKTPQEWEQALTALLGVITGSLGTIVSFWFSRGRPNS